MKKLFVLVLAILAMFTMISCEDPAAPPPAPPVVLEWMDVVPEGFWEITEWQVNYEGGTSRMAGDDGELIGDVFIVFGDDNVIYIWDDADDDGILTPGELLDDSESWSLVDGVLFAFGREMTPVIENEDLWVGRLDIEDTAVGQYLLGLGHDIDGYADYVFERRLPSYMDENDLISTEFSFAFDDMNDYDIYEGRYITYPTIDCVDWFEFQWGDVDVTVGNSRSYGGVIWVNGIGWTLCPLFEDNIVYTMKIVVQPDDVASVTFYDEYNEVLLGPFDLMVPYDDLGEVQIVKINDVDVESFTP